MTNDKTKEQYIVDFIKAFKAIEDEIAPYQEHRRDLKKNYVDNSWLSKEELRFAVRAYRMLKKGDDMTAFKDVYDKISRSITV
jgi:hypothetical protein